MRKLINLMISFPEWLRAGRTDLQAAHQRRLTSAYRAKKRKAKTVWIVGCSLMLLYPQLPFVVIIALLTTFLSLGILDSD